MNAKQRRYARRHWLYAGRYRRYTFRYSFYDPVAEMWGTCGVMLDRSAS